MAPPHFKKKKKAAHFFSLHKIPPDDLSQPLFPVAAFIA
jgi:hypothetical protein